MSYPRSSRINSLPEGYRAGIRTVDFFEDEMEPGEVFYYVLFHWERPRYGLRKRWVRVDQVRLGPARNPAVEAALRGIWIRDIENKNLIYPPREVYRR